MLNNILLLLLTLVYFAAMRRCTGSEKSWLGAHDGILGTVLFWALPTALYFLIFMQVSFVQFIMIGLAAFAGKKCFPQNKYDDFSQVFDKKENHYRWAYLTMRGTFHFIFVAAYLSWLGHDVSALLLVPAGMGVAYWLGQKLPNVASWLHRGREWGEILTCVPFGVGALLTVLQNT